MRQFVISDIHGCLQSLKALIAKIGLTFEDELYFLGDYIDKGKDSAGVIDFILQLKAENYHIFTLRGNHEENTLYALENYNPKTFTHFVKTLNKSGNLLGKNGRLIEKYRLFMQELPYFFELENFWLVHAGFNIKNPEKCFTDTISMLEKREVQYDETLFKGKTIIHGHQIYYLERITNAISQRNKIIPLDNGCVYTKKHKIYDVSKIGQLACLQLDNWELTLQPNIDN